MSTITRIETTVVDYDVVAHFKFFGPGPVRRPTVVVKITDDQGRVGWGQSVPSRTWSYETTESVRTTIDNYLGPALIGQDVDDMENVGRVMRREIAPSFSIGQPLCKAGIDLALFDLSLKRRQLTAAESWGRATRDSIRLSWTIDVRDLDELDAQIEAARARGFGNFNIKVGADTRLDVAVCRGLRDASPSAFLWVDANGAYDLDTALAVAPKFAELGIAAFEQPVPANRLSWFRRLREQGALPILMDEGVLSVVDLEEFHRLGLLDGIAMKVSRCGGLTESRRVMDFVERNGLLFFASGLTDPDISLSASLHLLAAYQLDRPAALNGPQFLAGTILERPIRIEHDLAFVPEGFGLGVSVDESRL